MNAGVQPCSIHLYIYFNAMSLDQVHSRNATRAMFTRAHNSHVYTEKDGRKASTPLNHPLENIDIILERYPSICALSYARRCFFTCIANMPHKNLRLVHA